jgi:hypothetical protein
VLLPIHIISFHIVWDLHIQNPSVFSDQCACRIIIIVEIDGTFHPHLHLPYHHRGGVDEQQCFFFEQLPSPFPLACLYKQQGDTVVDSVELSQRPIPAKSSLKRLL